MNVAPCANLADADLADDAAQQLQPHDGQARTTVRVVVNGRVVVHRNLLQETVQSMVRCAVTEAPFAEAPFAFHD
jgi:hypothetical protein